MRRFISAELKLIGIPKKPGVVDVCLGIYTPEWQRANDSGVQYIAIRFPLLEQNMSRLDCITYLSDHGLPRPPSSSCTFCPYHDLGTWQEMKRRGGHDWEEAVAVDALIRDKRPPFDLFLSPRRLPLEDAIQIPEDAGIEQLGLFDRSVTVDIAGHDE